jgi:serine/threonine protein kinase
MTSSSLQGTMLGRYRVLEPLGRGGMARVYRGYHPELDRYVAIKVLSPELVEEPFLARFQREARAVAALRHPNIVQVHDFDVRDGLYYMVMELLEGDTLQARLNDQRVRGQRMPRGEAVRVALDVLEGLAYAHSQGIIHRDIKPGNILLTRHGQAVLGDFGIAQIVGGTQHTASGALMGTLRYMAPEQGIEGRSDARSDLYSLGVVFYEMLVQRTPYQADTPLAVLIQHVNEPLPLLHTFDPSLPEPLEQVAIRALEKTPEDRYQSAGEMAQALWEASAAAGVALPDHIALPRSFTTEDAPLESVTVLSGPDLVAVDPRYGEEDTLVTVGGGSTQEDPRERPATYALGRGLVGRTRQTLHAAVKAVESDVRELPSAVRAVAHDLSPSEEIRARRRRWRPFAYAVGGWLIISIIALLLSALAGWWDALRIGWPMELFFVAGVLSSLMVAIDLPLLLGAVGFLAGNGLIFLYCTATGNWRSWIYLPILEAALMGGCAFLALWLRRYDVHARRLGRLLGRPLTVALFSIGIAILGLSVVLGLVALLRFATTG